MKESANDERVDLRLPRLAKDRLRKIAALSGRSMSDFIVAAALEKADEAAASIERWELDARDSRFVMDILTTKDEDRPGLRELLAATDSQR